MSHIAFIFNAVLGTHVLGANFEGVVDSIDDYCLEFVITLGYQLACFGECLPRIGWYFKNF